MGALDIEEKPNTPALNYAIVGFSLCENDVVESQKNFTSLREGELEIANMHLRRGALRFEPFKRGGEAGRGRMLALNRFVLTPSSSCISSKNCRV